ncbi:MAG: AAA-like domain-containing protein [Polyangiaceae bacterium]|nr:AAA-like domain-containing protein [Polyangiaceae bacterium]
MTTPVRERGSRAMGADAASSVALDADGGRRIGDPRRHSGSVPRVHYTVGGPVQAEGGIYLARAADDELLEHCLRGDFVYILTARQLGKSSLMCRTVEVLRAAGHRSVVIDLQGIGKPETAEQWYRGLVLELESELELELDADRWWREHAEFGFAHRLTRFLREVVVCSTRQRIVIFVDEIDTTLSLEYTDDFFVAIRYLHGARTQAPELKRLSFVLLGVATPSDLIKDGQRTPFNIGYQVEMTDFTLAEATPLADGLAAGDDERSTVLARVLHWTGGHPYLTLRAFASLRDRPPEDWSATAVDGRITELFFAEAGQNEHNLQFVRSMLTDKAPGRNRVLDLFAAVQRRRPVPDSRQDLAKNWLKLSGAVRVEEGRLRVRNRVYERVFPARWAVQQQSVDWSRRFRQLLVAVVAVAALLGVVLVPWYVQSRETAQALEREQAALGNLSREKDRVQKALRDAETLAKKLATEKTRAESALTREQAASKQAAEQRDLAQAEKTRAETATSAAERNLLRSQSLHLASRAELAAHDRYVVGGLLAVESVELGLARGRRPDPVALDSLRTFARQSLPLRGHEDLVTAASFSPDGKQVVTASVDKTARVWNADGSGQAVVLRGHERVVESASFSPNGKRVVTASYDGTARVWNANGSGQAVVLRGHERVVESASFSQDGKRVVTASYDGTARVWNADGSGQAVLMRGHETFVVAASFSQDGKRVVTASYDGTARVWNVDGSGEAVVLRGHERVVESASFSPNGKRVVTASYDGTARVWNVDGSGKPVVLRGHEGLVVSASFSQDGKRVVTASYDGTARVWNVDGSGEPVVLRGHGVSVLAASLSPDGKRVVTASSDGTARVWNANGSGEPVVLRGHEDSVTAASFSPDGKRVVTASSDKTARLWDAGSGSPISVLRGHSGAVGAAAFSPDGTHVLTASHDATARVWLADPTTLIPAICRGAGRNLTRAEWNTYIPDRPYHATCAAYGVPDGGE